MTQEQVRGTDEAQEVQAEETQGTAPAERRSPGRPRQTVSIAEFNTVQDSLASLNQRFDEFKANASRREGALERDRDRAQKAAELGPDSQEFRFWEREADQKEGRRQAEVETAAARLETAKWRTKSEFPQVPESVYGAANDPQAMELAALRWMSTSGTAAAYTPAGEEEHPQTPRTVTTQGARGAPGVSDQEWLNRYADEVNGGIPPTPANTQRAKELRDKGLSAQPLQTQ